MDTKTITVLIIVAAVILVAVVFWIIAYVKAINDMKGAEVITGRILSYSSDTYYAHGFQETFYTITIETENGGIVTYSASPRAFVDIVKGEMYEFSIIGGMIYSCDRIIEK